MKEGQQGPRFIRFLLRARDLSAYFLFLPGSEEAALQLATCTEAAFPDDLLRALAIRWKPGL
jgi:hypothetical protein